MASINSLTYIYNSNDIAMNNMKLSTYKQWLCSYWHYMIINIKISNLDNILYMINKYQNIKSVQLFVVAGSPSVLTFSAVLAVLSAWCDWYVIMDMIWLLILKYEILTALCGHGSAQFPDFLHGVGGPIRDPLWCSLLFWKEHSEIQRWTFAYMYKWIHNNITSLMIWRSCF